VISVSQRGFPTELVVLALGALPEIPASWFLPLASAINLNPTD